MERGPAGELTHEEIRKTLGLKGNCNPALSEGLLVNMHALIQDHNLPPVSVGRSIGLNLKESNKFLSYPHLKKFSTDKFGNVRMFFQRTNEAKAEVRRLYEQSGGDHNAVAFQLGLDTVTVKNLLGKVKSVPEQTHGKGIRLRVAGNTFSVRELVDRQNRKK